MTFLLFGVVGAAVGLGWYLMSPAAILYHRDQHQSELPRFFRALIELMREGGIVHIRHEASDRAFQFRKVLRADGSDALRLEFPDFPAARREIVHIRECLHAAGFRDARSRTLHPIWPAQGTMFMVADGLSAIDAFRAAEVVREAMGLSQDERFTMHIDAVPSVKVYREHREARVKG